MKSLYQKIRGRMKGTDGDKGPENKNKLLLWMLRSPPSPTPTPPHPAPGKTASSGASCALLHTRTRGEGNAKPPAKSHPKKGLQVAREWEESRIKVRKKNVQE